jgi:hypothetical protein
VVGRQPAASLLPQVRFQQYLEQLAVIGNFQVEQFFHDVPLADLGYTVTAHRCSSFDRILAMACW